MSTDRDMQIGLALGAGGARGWAHIGVLKVLEEKGIPIHMIAGTSIGAVVGAIYAKTLSSKETEELITSTFPDRGVVKKRFYDFTFPKKGMLKGNKVRTLLRIGLQDINFSALKIPLYVVATNLITGEEVVIEKGAVADALRASISIPGIFHPVELNGRWLVDGALANPVPVSVLIKKGASFTISVFIEDRTQDKLTEQNDLNILTILTRSFGIMGRRISSGASRLSDISIHIDVSGFQWDDFHRGPELIKLGEEATKDVIYQIKKQVPSDILPPN
ncbi:MAG TPA: patatin family protein [Syntrophaceae bacterium]|nr:patatin family protein [Syntrophaceae bacterium]